VPKLVIFRGDAVENELRLAGRPVRIGRDARNDIVLDDKSVSRFHAEVRAEGNTYFIVDLKSRNGVWINGQQAKGKAALAFGAPVTLGAFELALEDDVATGEFDELAPVIEPSRSGKVPVDQPDRPSASATRASMRAPVATKRQIMLWSVAAVAILLIALVAIAVIKYMNRPTTNVEVVAPPQTPPSPQVRIPDQVPPPADDPIKSTIERHLAEAQAAQSRSDWATVREHATRILELQPDNQAARDLKRQADAGVRGAKPPQVAVAPISPPPAAAEVETPLIPRRPGESWAEYTKRVDSIKANLEAGKSYLAKGDFAYGIARLQAVSAAAKGYQGVEALIADAETKQRAAFAEAMALGKGLGLSPKVLFDSLLGSPTVAPFLALKREKIEGGNYEAEFPLQWMQKDLHLASVSAYESGVALPLTNVTKEIYRFAMRGGHDTEDFSAICEFTMGANRKERGA